MSHSYRKQGRKFLQTSTDTQWKALIATPERQTKAAKQQPSADPRDTLAPHNEAVALGQLYLQGSAHAVGATAPTRQAMLTAGVLLTTVIAGGQAGQMLALAQGPVTGPLALSNHPAAASHNAVRRALQQTAELPAAPSPSEVFPVPTPAPSASAKGIERAAPAPAYPYGGMTYEEVASALPYSFQDVEFADELTYALSENILWLDKNQVPDALEGTLQAAWAVAKKLNITEPPSQILGEAEYQATQTATGTAENGVSRWSRGGGGTKTPVVAGLNQGTAAGVAADNTSLPAIPAVNQVLSSPTSFYQSSYQPKSYAWHAGTASLFPAGGVQPGNLAQNNLGDCTLSAMIASVALTNPQIIQNNIKALGNGTYAVTLYDEVGQPTVIKVNDQFPILPNGSLAYIANQNWRYGGIPNNPVLWPMLLEKACAIQWSNMFSAPSASYLNLDANKGYSNPTAMFSMLTGGASDYQMVSSDGAANAALIKTTLAGGSPLIAGTSSNDNDVINGVDGGHSYTVVGVTANNDVILRNPWGGLNPIKVPDIVLNHGRDEGYFRISMKTFIEDFGAFTINYAASGALPRVNLTDAAGSAIDPTGK